ncbi:MAG: TonB-dependent receptor [Pseudomonadota bacterium]
MKPITLRSALSAAASAAVIAASAGASDDVVRIEMPAQPLGQAVASFSEQADVAVVAPAALLSGRRANALSGEFTIASALDAMLAGSAVEARADASGAYILAAASTAIVVQDEDDEEEIKDVVVVKGFRSSFASSLRTKREANQVVDAITAEEIGQFADQNVTEAVQRISGVQITRNNGEGESVSIRGLSPTFTRVELDGRSTNITIDSANPERQSVLSVFSSDLYNSIEIIKSPTAADVEGGLGGIVRLNTPDPLRVGELRFGLEGTLTDAEYRDDEEPGVNGFYINTFLDNRFGVLVSGSYEARDRRVDRIENTNGYSIVEGGPLDGAAFAERHRQEIRIGDVDRYNYNIKLEFQPTDALRLFADIYGANEERAEDRSRLQIDWSRGDLIGGEIGAGGQLTSAQFESARTDVNTFRRNVDIESLGFTVGAEFENEDWKILLEGNSASSEEDFEEFRAQARGNEDGSYDLSADPEFPVIAADGATANLRIRNNGSNLQRRIISIEEEVARFDVERFVNLGAITSFEGGFRYAAAEFERSQGQINSPERPRLNDGVDGFAFDGRTFGFGEGGPNALTSWTSVDPELLYLANPSDETFSFNDENLWTIEETTTAFYALANYELNVGWTARGNFGVRVVTTDYSGDGAEDVIIEDEDFLDLTGEDGDFGNVGFQTLDRDYTDVLPSFNFVLSPSEDAPLLVRGAVSKALTRPDINAINPGLVVRVETVENDGVILPDGEPTDEGTFEAGNPDLEPFEAWQYDLGLEYYFGENDESALSVAFFYKDIENFIFQSEAFITYSRPELGIGTLGDIDLRMGDFSFNGGEATVQGFEVGFQTPFSFLPAPLDGLGVFANYTYTDSEFTDNNGATLPFPGASENAFNVAGYYEIGGFSARLAYNYRDEFLDEPGDDDGTDNIFTDEQGRLDLAVRYRFENGIRLSFDALNLTEEFNYDYFDRTDRLRRREFESTIYTFAIAYTF